MKISAGDGTFPIPLDVPKQEEKRDRAFSLSDISLLLYEEISRELGIGEEERLEYRNGVRLTRQINPNHRLTGFQGAIHYEKFLEHTHFYLFEDIDVKDHVLEIVGGSKRGGVWAHGYGDFMIEKLRAELEFGRGLSLDSPATKLICLILWRAHQLATNPNCYQEEFWSKD